jgi:hypothetical protein
VAAGAFHGVGILWDGRLKTWGSNNNGQNPGTVSDYFLQVAAGDVHTIATKWDGSVQCWGSNLVGQCDVPPDLAPATAIAGSWFTTVIATREETAEQSVRLFEFEVESTLPGDINNDGQVNGADLGLLLAAWGVCVDPANCPGDFNEDGQINGSDLGTLLAYWTG